MDFILRIDNDIIAIIILLIILFRAPRKLTSEINQTSVFYYLVVSVLFMLILDVFVWTINGTVFESARAINYWLNYIHIFMSPLSVILWMAYIYYLAHNDFKKLIKKIIFLLVPFIINASLMVITLFNDFVFYIDESNLYHRNSGVYISFAISISMILITLTYAFTERKHLRRKAVIPVISFGVLPLVGGIVQILFYGTSLIWSSAALALLILYIFIEFSEMSIDYLTGLPNRKRVDAYIHSEIKHAQGGNSDFALLMIDLDGFKVINDTFGHVEGDQALITFSNILMQSTKRADMVSRFAGDEFLIVLHLQHTNDIDKVILRIKNNVESYNKKKVVPYQLKYSIGHLHYDSQQFALYKDVLKEVDDRMYMNKQKNRQ